MNKPAPEIHTMLQLRRTFAAPPVKVFRAWTDPEAIKKWFNPGGRTIATAEIDLRIGGRYRFGMRGSDGPILYISGVYREIESPSRLVFTWAFEGDPAFAEDTLVTVQCLAKGDGTEVVLTHERLPGEAARQNHLEGWTGCLDKLASII
jgi:uncharacterized protein YndB with AHSA1/START domain